MYHQWYFSCLGWMGGTSFFVFVIGCAIGSRLVSRVDDWVASSSGQVSSLGTSSCQVVGKWGGSIMSCTMVDGIN